MKIPFSRAPVTFEGAAPYLKEALDNGWLTTGPLTLRFTKGLMEYLGTENLVPLSSCTAALQIALAAANLKPGDEVIVPANTFIATFETVELAGLTPVLADIDADTWNISPETAATRITARTKAMIVVPFAGNPPRLAELKELAERHGLILILDNAHALETKLHGKFLHTYADFSCYSFYATKNLTTAEGGAIIAPKDQVERVRTLSLHGMSRAAWNRYAGGSWRYDILETGFKANLTDIHAALGLAQLDSLKAHLAKRMELMTRYRRSLSHLPLRFQGMDKGVADSEHAWHLCCISVKPGSPFTRDSIMTALAAADIGYSVHFIPIYEFSSVREKYGFKPEDFPATSGYFEGALSLPLYPTLSFEDQDRVISVIRSLFEKNGGALAG